MARADTGMSGQRTNGNRMVQQQRNQIKHILHPIKKVREELLSQQPGLQKIVPVSISAELSDNNFVLQKETASLEFPMNTEKISIRKNDIEIEIPCNADEHIISAILRGLKQC